MIRRATIVPCRKKDCPDKPASEKKWCLIDSNDTAKRCAPTKKQCKEQERNVNYFKHVKKGSARLTTAMVQETLQRLPVAHRVAALRAALAAGFRPTLVKFAGKLWRLH